MSPGESDMGQPLQTKGCNHCQLLGGTTRQTKNQHMLPWPPSSHPTCAHILGFPFFPQLFPASISLLSEQREQLKQQPDRFGHIFPNLVPFRFIHLFEQFA